ncbi:RNA polymerase sigma factor [Sutcliffiella deserti]|uniref:RNA polymerase sigma factor n=1 Tax=Sutcliffiella deserti TaxID=2875501 RepID=UPI001CBD4694|nr:RNA polymerase sigma factor [Sutcliffiella deserti]
MNEEWNKLKLEEWYQLYSEDIYRFVLMLIGDHDQAKDLCHDTFLKAYFSLNDFKGETSDRNWLYRIARNVTIDYMRKKKPIRYMVDSFSSMAAHEPLPESIIQLGEREEHLYRSLQALKRSYREVIILRKIKELSIRETAEVLNWTENKVKITLFRGMEALKQQMIKEGYTHETF